MGPSANPGEEVALSRPGNVGWGEVGDGASVDGSLRDVAMGDEAFQPGGCEVVVLVVERGRDHALTNGR